MEVFKILIKVNQILKMQIFNKLSYKHKFNKTIVYLKRKKI